MDIYYHYNFSIYLSLHVCANISVFDVFKNSLFHRCYQSTCQFIFPMATLFNSLRSQSDSTALIVPSETTPVIFSHRQLFQQAQELQKTLADLGILPGDTIAIAFPNTIELAVAFLAISFQRAISAPLNPAYKQEEFEFYLQDLSATIILLPKGAVAENGEAARAAKVYGCAIAEIWWNGTKVQLEMIVKGGMKDNCWSRVETPLGRDVALVLHTSGTTGRPKAVRWNTHLLHRQLTIILGTSAPQKSLSNHDEHCCNVSTCVQGPYTSHNATISCPRSSGRILGTPNERWVFHHASPVLRFRVLARFYPTQGQLVYCRPNDASDSPEK